jgi:hypothetical protein
MPTLLSDRFAPITSAIGFLEIGLEAAGDALLTWRRHLYGEATLAELREPLTDALHRLEPLTVGVRPRELLGATAGPWTAYFDCGAHGGDPVSTIGYLCRVIGCRGVVAVSIPDTAGTKDERPGRYGAVQFELYGPDMTEFLNYIRTVSAVNDGGRWRFDASGEVQVFENLDAYRRRRKRDRFTSDMLAEYLASLGLRAFDEEFYEPRAVLVESKQPLPDGGLTLSLADAQARQGIAAADDASGQLSTTARSWWQSSAAQRSDG